jgi:hypothetical protein
MNDNPSLRRAGDTTYRLRALKEAVLRGNNFELAFEDEVSTHFKELRRKRPPLEVFVEASAKLFGRRNEDVL